MLHFRREITYEIQIAFINLTGQISLLMINNWNFSMNRLIFITFKVSNFIPSNHIRIYFMSADLYQIVYRNETYTHGLL